MFDVDIKLIYQINSQEDIYNKIQLNYCTIPTSWVGFAREEYLPNAATI